MSVGVCVCVRERMCVYTHVGVYLSVRANIVSLWCHAFGLPMRTHTRAHVHTRTSTLPHIDTHWSDARC